MSYNAIAALVNDYDFRMRLYACAGQENIPNPQMWIDENAWKLCSNTEFEAPYSYALGNNVVRPGHDEGVISDALILAHVQPLWLSQQTTE